MPRAIFSLIVTLFAVLATPALAQDVQINFGQSLRLDGSALEVTADSLEVDQTSGATVFSGNVLAVQGGMRITADQLTLEYVAGPTEGTRRIGQLLASGNVTMVTEREAIEAQQAVYSMTNQSLEMSGDVVLVQGSSLLSGQRFVADLRTGSGRMIGRVRTIISMD